MRRLLIAFMLLSITTAAFAFDTKKARMRVGVLRVADEFYRRGEELPANALVKVLQNELRERGIDAFDAGVTWADRHELPEADYFVEVMGADAHGSSRGGVGIGTREVGVTIEKVVTYVGTEIRIYDGRTLEPIVSEPLSRQKKAILPTSVGIGGSRLWAILAMPIAEWAQYRAATQAVAKDAAELVADTLAGQ